MGGIWAADNKSVRDGASALLRHSHPYGEEHGGVQGGLIATQSITKLCIEPSATI